MLIWQHREQVPHSDKSLLCITACDIKMQYVTRAHRQCRERPLSHGSSAQDSRAGGHQSPLPVPATQTAVYHFSKSPFLPPLINSCPKCSNNVATVMESYDYYPPCVWRNDAISGTVPIPTSDESFGSSCSGVKSEGHQLGARHKGSQ